MKFTDIDKTLVTEAPEAFDKPQGRLNRAATKIKKKIGPTKKIRQRASGKAEYQKQALDIKDQFHNWSGAQDRGTSVEDFKAFAEEEYPQLVAVIDKIAAKLKFVPKPKPEPRPDDSADQQAEQPSPDEEDLISPEEMTGDKDAGQSSERTKEPTDPTKKPEGMEQEEYDSIKAAYAKNAEEDQEESVEEDSDDAEPKVDMSASIYEARFTHMLLLERDLKDNQLDTLIVRVLQAAGSKSSSSAPEQAPKDNADTTSPAKKSDFTKKLNKAGKSGSGMLKRAGKAMFGDLAGRDDDEDSGSRDGSSGLDLDSSDQRALRQILRKIANDKPLSDQEKRAAQNIAKQL